MQITMARTGRKLSENPDFLALVREYERRAAAAKAPITRAEIVPSHSPIWYALATATGGEKIAAAHLVGRGYGVFLPEIEGVEVKRGVKRDFTRPMLPGYLFVFVWNIELHARRLRCTPGVYYILSADGCPASIPDALIHDLQAMENLARPLASSLNEGEAIRPKKKRWRKSCKPKQSDDFVLRSEPFCARVIPALDIIARNRLLERSNGLAS